MKVNVLNKTGKVVEQKDYKFLDIEPNVDLVALSVKIYLGNQRESNAHTKDRGDVTGSTRKLYRQKGTGNARRGSVKSPLLRGGGTVFGPKNDRNYKRKLSKKLRLLAMLSALNMVASSDGLYVSKDKFDFTKTKEANEFIKLLNFKKLLIVQNGDEPMIYKAFVNLKGYKVANLSELSVYDIIDYGKVIFTEESIKSLEARYES